MNDIAIKVENLSKYYKLGVIGSGTLKKDLQSKFYKMRGKEDPNKQIGYKESDADGFWALNDLNFEIKKGDRVGIIGKNGAGKSTLLKMLSQISAPTKGKIYIDGKIASLLEVGTGFNPELTGRENIYLNGAILGMKKKEIDRKVEEIIAFSEIEKHIDTPVKRYSSGMYVRLAFAVAAHLDSDILIADEVLAVGDANFQKKALGKMNQLSTGEGRTVLFVSHNMNQVRNLCNKGIILDHGKLLRQDDDINQSIAYYLGTNADGINLVTTNWKNNESFNNKNFKPLSLQIVDDNNNLVTEALDYNKNYKFKLDFEVEEPETNVDFWISIYNGLERVSSLGMPENFEYKKGLNSLEYTIPAKTLIPGNYIFSLGSSLKKTQWIVNSFNYEITINTTIKNSGSPLFVPTVL